MSLNLLQNQTTTEILTGDTVSGYVFAGPTENGRQQQEWVLFPNFQHANREQMTLRPVSAGASDWNRNTLEEFAAHVAWREQVGWRYCHAIADLTLGASKQIEINRNIAWVMDVDRTPCGFVYAHDRNPANPNSETTEFWSFFGTYKAAPTSVVYVDSCPGQILDEYVVVQTVVVHNHYDDIRPTA